MANVLAVGGSSPTRRELGDATKAHKQSFQRHRELSEGGRLKYRNLQTAPVRIASKKVRELFFETNAAWLNSSAARD